MNKSVLLLLLLMFILGLSYCTKDKGPDPAIKASSDCDSTKILYCNKIHAIIDLNCATSGCHISGGTGAGDFSTYAGVKSKVDNGSFRARVLDMRDMPASNPLSDADTTIISTWLTEGAKEK